MRRSFPFSLDVSHKHILYFAHVFLTSKPHSRMESALYGQERRGVNLPGTSYVVGFLPLFMFVH